MRRLTGLMVAMVAAILFGAAVVVTDKWSSVRQAATQTDTVFDPAAVASRELLSDYVDQESGQRGYIITGDPSYLAPYGHGLVAARRDLANLRALVASMPALLADVDAVAKAGAAWRAAIGPQLRARAAGNTTTADALVSAGTGRAAFDRVRVAIARLQGAVDTARMRGEHAQRAATTVLSTTLIATAGVLAGVVVALTIGAWRVIGRPLDRLSAQLHTVSGGAIHTRLAASGVGEIAALGRDAEVMRARLVEQIDTAGPVGVPSFYYSQLYKLGRPNGGTRDEPLDAGPADRRVHAGELRLGGRLRGDRDRCASRF
ncbi:MAG TPA: CHASE3 domain-containing protein, partial [Mycobacteriales bacterium]|nr:CHASE3 domain-containing protein [Mycobacteriales bacterium]